MQFLHSRVKILFLIVLFLIPLFIFAFDKDVMLFIKHFQKNHMNLNQFFEELDMIMDFVYKAAIIVISLFAIYSLFKKKEVGKSLSMGIIAVSIVIQIKHLIGRARPRLGFDTFFAGPSLNYLYSSFPSGHTTFAFMLATVFSHYYPKYRYLFYAFAIWVGFERVEDFAHFPSDVLAGAVLGAIIGRFVIFKLLPKTDQNRSI
ncbi:phosphatase PAP2 family protein [Thermodesulfovibrio sp. 3907-1M]|uniref:Phosphatase PAP2 family protein n=1 Tax=Thermodesulfovibrio autotrophicus TaxID=3118333 RepID=A0AAU8GUH6_9BACT